MQPDLSQSNDDFIKRGKEIYFRAGYLFRLRIYYDGAILGSWRVGQEELAAQHGATQEHLEKLKEIFFENLGRAEALIFEDTGIRVGDLDEREPPRGKESAAVGRFYQKLGPLAHQVRPYSVWDRERGEMSDHSTYLTIERSREGFSWLNRVQGRPITLVEATPVQKLPPPAKDSAPKNQKKAPVYKAPVFADYEYKPRSIAPAQNLIAKCNFIPISSLLDGLGNGNSSLYASLILARLRKSLKEDLTKKHGEAAANFCLEMHGMSVRGKSLPISPEIYGLCLKYQSKLNDNLPITFDAVETALLLARCVTYEVSMGREAFQVAELIQR